MKIRVTAFWTYFGGACGDINLMVGDDSQIYNFDLPFCALVATDV